MRRKASRLIDGWIAVPRLCTSRAEGRRRVPDENWEVTGTHRERDSTRGLRCTFSAWLECCTPKLGGGGSPPILDWSKSSVRSFHAFHRSGIFRSLRLFELHELIRWFFVTFTQLLCFCCFHSKADLISSRRFIWVIPFMLKKKQTKTTVLVFLFWYGFFEGFFRPFKSLGTRAGKDETGKFPEKYLVISSSTLLSIFFLWDFSEKVA